MVKAVLLSFSGRFGVGNCSKVLDLIQSIYEGEGVEVSRIQMIDLQITPCIRCTYECMSPTGLCPHTDDVASVYRAIMEADCCIAALPVYSAALPALYFAWRERSQCIFRQEETFERYRKVKKAYIVIGNREAGGESALEILRTEDLTDEKAMLLLENHAYHLNSLAGRLTEVPEVRKIIDQFIHTL